MRLVKYSVGDKLESIFPKIFDEIKGNCNYLALEFDTFVITDKSHFQNDKRDFGETKPDRRGQSCYRLKLK